MIRAVNDVLNAFIHAYPTLWIIWGAILGAVLGSFINCMRVRLQTGENLRYPPSKCDACNKRLTVLDLVPIFSYLFLRGQCRYCGVQIGRLSLWTEVVSTAVGAALFFCITQAL